MREACGVEWNGRWPAFRGGKRIAVGGITRLDENWVVAVERMLVLVVQRTGMMQVRLKQCISMRRPRFHSRAERDVRHMPTSSPRPPTETYVERDTPCIPASNL